MGSLQKYHQAETPTYKIMRVFLSFSFLLALASSTPIPDSPPPPPEPYNAAPSYAFKYNVNDSPYGPVFSHGENREGYNAEGEYQVNLPDGRVATVTYKVDGPSGGFIADVKYDGVSVYPDAPPVPYHPAPSYAPAPAPPAPKAAAPVAPASDPAAEVPTDEINLRAGAPADTPEPAAPVYEPAPAPVYKPAPSPYEARQILTPDSSVKKYSFKIIEPAPKAAPEATTAEVPTAEINLRRGQEEERQSRLLINEIIPENDFDEEISTEGALIQEIASEEIIAPAEEIILIEPIVSTEAVPIKEEEEELIVISPVEEVVLVEEPEIIEQEVVLVEEPEIIQEEVALVQEPEIIEEEFVQEATPTIIEEALEPEGPVFTPSSLPPASAQEELIIPVQEPIVGTIAPPAAPVEPIVVVDEIAQEADVEAAAQDTLPRRVRQKRPNIINFLPQPSRGVSGVFRELRGRTSKLMRSVIGLLGN